VIPVGCAIVSALFTAKGVAVQKQKPIVGRRGETADVNSAECVAAGNGMPELNG
jgi:hypothetical protein